MHRCVSILHEALPIGVEHSKDALVGLELLFDLKYQLLGVVGLAIYYLDHVEDLVECGQRDLGVRVGFLHSLHLPHEGVLEEPIEVCELRDDEQRYASEDESYQAAAVVGHFVSPLVELVLVHQALNVGQRDHQQVGYAEA